MPSNLSLRCLFIIFWWHWPGGWQHCDSRCVKPLTGQVTGHALSPGFSLVVKAQRWLLIGWWPLLAPGAWPEPVMMWSVSVQCPVTPVIIIMIPLITIIIIISTVSAQFSCPGPGFWPDPGSCTAFYQCQPPNRVYKYICPPGTRCVQIIILYPAY